MQSAVNGDASPSKARSAAGRTSHRAAHQLIRLNLIQRIFGGGVLLPLFVFTLWRLFGLCALCLCLQIKIPLCVVPKYLSALTIA